MNLWTVSESKRLEKWDQTIKLRGDISSGELFGDGASGAFRKEERIYIKREERRKHLYLKPEELD